MPRPHVIIIGGGFAGLRAAKELRDTNVRVTLIDRQNHHCFQPLLYQVATAALGTQDIAAPIRKVLRHQENVTVLMEEVVDIDVDARVVETSTTELGYDYLILAAGARTHYFNPDWEEQAPGLKTLADAVAIRSKVLLAYEAAEREQDEQRRREWLNFVVIGAGPTGVELAGALSEIATKTLSRNFRTFDPGDARVFLIEGLDAVLPQFPAPELRARAHEQLLELGVDVRLGTLVDRIEDDRAVLADGTEIPTRTVLWAAGVRAEDIAGKLGVEQDKMGRVAVDTSLNIEGHPEVFVVGDIARCVDANGVEVPGLAPAALQMGEHAAQNIRRALGERSPQAFKYRDKGQMATIGRSKAVAMSPRRRSTPVPARLRSAQACAAGSSSPACTRAPGTSSATASQLSRVRAPSTTSAPCSAKRSAMSRPMPGPMPEMMATLPSSSTMSSCDQSLTSGATSAAKAAIWSHSSSGDLLTKPTWIWSTPRSR